MNKEIQDIFKILSEEISRDKIGSIVFSYLDISVTLNDKSPIGNILQEWLGAWLKKHNFIYDTNPNTQEPPDFYIGQDRKHLELKSFDYDASPNFDVANFEAYCSLLLSDPTAIDSDYLILAYRLEQGNLTIQDMWLKKVWEICCPSEKYPLKTQNKRGMIYNIRPATWFSKNSHYSTFASKKDFLYAIQNTLNQYSKTRVSHKNWLERVTSKYREITNREIF